MLHRVDRLSLYLKWVEDESEGEMSEQVGF